MIQRAILSEILAKLKPNKVCLLFGARRVGKTIVLQKVVERFKGKSLVLNGEDYETLQLLEPRSISNYKRLLNGIDLLVIDEAQNIPEIGKKLKLMVDEIKGIKIVATGSSAFDLLNLSGEPLTGRSSSHYLYSVAQMELSKTETILQTRQNLDERLIYGSYPEVLMLKTQDEKKEYLNDIKQGYLLKDILMIDGLRSSNKMYDLLKLLAFQVGQEVSYNELGNHLGISKNTVEKYLDLLTKTFVLYRLGAYSGNLRKEITKSQKWYFLDNGIRNAIVSDFKLLSLRQDKGLLWENYFIMERIKYNAYNKINCNYYFWRTYDGQEIDFIEEKNRKLTAFEIKWTANSRWLFERDSATETKVKQPVFFAKSYPNASFNIITQENYRDWIM